MEIKKVLKIVISPPKIEARRLPGNKFQITEQKGKQAFHRNLSDKEVQKWFEDTFKPPFKQAQVFLEDHDLHILLNKKGEQKVIKKKATHAALPIVHNREKKHLLTDDIFQKLKITPDKKIQVDRFLQLADDILNELPSPFKAIDFGCGKAYLTFALFHYLKDKGLKFNLTGIDSKKEVIDNLKKETDEITFQVGDIAKFKGEFDLAIALHACDVATDIAIVKAIKGKAKVLLLAPCCQQEFLKQIKNEELSPLLKHGLLKERFASLLTDTVRGLFLESHGYDVQMIEFVDYSHTPKNLLIRAVHKPTKSNMEKANKALKQILDQYSLNPLLIHFE